MFSKELTQTDLGQKLTILKQHTTCYFTMDEEENGKIIFVLEEN